ncbi:MAG: hypothetical protein CFE37_05290 [Alphaproteobacteria bacterium PA4]|nr:MAG: hypothetical protein CFE37_05290 [Alphaproteobacteria bacterium PA4]
MSESAPPAAAAVWRTLWRWHFYAGLLSVPFILILSITGALYLFKGDYEHWEERHWRALPAVAAPVDADAQLAAALARHPGATLKGYRLPQAGNDAAIIDIETPTGPRQIVVSPFGGAVLADMAPDDRLMTWLRELHGQLLNGRSGGWLVELVGSWAFVMVLTGLYLWWPRGRSGAAGVFWPRLRSGRRLFWRDLHAVTGIWVSGLALVLLLSALPWTGVWGNAFRIAKSVAGVDVRKQDWATGATGHEGHAMAGMAHDRMAMGPVTLARMAATARPLALTPPVMIVPPGVVPPGRREPAPDWIIRAEPQDRTQVVTLTYDAGTGALKSRRDFNDKPGIDRLVNYGISWHEGVLFGRINQAIGVLTALGMGLLAASSLLLWWRRRPDGVLGAPPVGLPPARLRGAMLLLCLMALLLPLLGVSLLVVALLESLLLRRIAPVARWLGLRTATVAAT